MRNARFAIAAMLAMLLVAAPTAAAASGKAKGNARGVALAQKVERAYRHVPVISYTETGFVSMYASLGKESVFSWRWGSGTVPPNWVKATQHVTAVMHKGVIAWIRDDLTPPACNNVCFQEPVEIVLEKSGAFYAYGPYKGTQLKHTCFAHLNGTFFYKLGEPFETAFGSFGAPKRHGKDLVLRSSYRWGKAHAKETELISAKTDLPQRFVAHVGRGSDGSAPFTFKGVLHYPAHAPKLPHINLCH